MEKLSGLILDQPDDTGCAVLKEIYPTADAIPAFVKQASLLSTEEREALPDSLFALVLHDGDITLRKYACHDPAHTALSVEYFLQLGHKLPAEAQQKVASNLQVACGWYELPEHPDLEKIAIAGMLLNAGKSLGGKALGAIKANPLGAGGKVLGAAMTAQGIAGAVGEGRQALKNVGAAEQAAGGFGRIIGGV